jgi:hypothetical protein
VARHAAAATGDLTLTSQVANDGTSASNDGTSADLRDNPTVID